MIYDVIFDGQKITIEADYINYIGTKASFRKGEELVAYFDVPFGTSFGYAVRPTKRAPDLAKSDAPGDPNWPDRDLLGTFDEPA